MTACAPDAFGFSICAAGFDDVVERLGVDDQVRVLP
jgi:hypothetical protein